MDVPSGSQSYGPENNGFGGLDAELTFNKTKFVQFVTDMKGWYDQGMLKLKSKNTGEDYVAAFASGMCLRAASSARTSTFFCFRRAPICGSTCAAMPSATSSVSMVLQVP